MVIGPKRLGNIAFEEEKKTERNLSHTIYKVSKVIQKKKHKFLDHKKLITISNLKSKFNLTKFWRLEVKKVKVDEQKFPCMDFVQDQESESQIVQLLFEEDDLFQVISLFYPKQTSVEFGFLMDKEKRALTKENFEHLLSLFNNNLFKSEPHFAEEALKTAHDQELYAAK